MISFRGSTSVTPADDCVEVPRAARQNNLQWLSKQIASLEREKVPETFVVLVGGIAVYDFRLRVAQSHLRADLTPSHWSHAAVITTPTSQGVDERSAILEASLEPYEGFHVPSMHNGLQAAPLSRYADAREYPNVAVIRIPVSRNSWRNKHGEQKSIVSQFADQRSVLDVPQLLLEWLAFVWCAGDAGNPTSCRARCSGCRRHRRPDRRGGLRHVAGDDTSASSPEALWQSAKWWQDYYKDIGVPQLATRYSISDELVADVVERPWVKRPRRAAERSATRNRQGAGSKGTASARVTVERAAPRVRDLGPRGPRAKMYVGDSMTTALFRQTKLTWALTTCCPVRGRRKNHSDVRNTRIWDRGDARK